jgi:Spy/CpxP family protein refolding chaperone
MGPSEEEKEKARIRIGMTKEQQAQIEAVYVESGKKREEAMRELAEKHRQLSAVYDSYEIDKAQERALLRDIVSIHWRLLRIHSEDEAKIRRILTKEQHEKLRALMKETMERMRKSWRGPGRGAPPGEGRR